MDVSFTCLRKGMLRTEDALVWFVHCHLSICKFNVVLSFICKIITTCHGSLIIDINLDRFSDISFWWIWRSIIWNFSGDGLSFCEPFKSLNWSSGVTHSIWIAKHSLSGDLILQLTTYSSKVWNFVILNLILVNTHGSLLVVFKGEGVEHNTSLSQGSVGGGLLRNLPF